MSAVSQSTFQLFSLNKQRWQERPKFTGVRSLKRKSQGKGEAAQRAGEKQTIKARQNAADHGRELVQKGVHPVPLEPKGCWCYTNCATENAFWQMNWVAALPR